MADTNLKTRAEHRLAGGWLLFLSHAARTTACDMAFSVFLPPQAEHGPVPVLYWLSGLTCTEENFMSKAGAQRFAAERGLMLVAPDTSPRGLGLPGEDADWDFGSGAGFYVNASQAPWAAHYRMYDYVVSELPEVVAANFPVASGRAGISGHSMGGHGALVIGLRNPGLFRSISAFAPICAPASCPWGVKAFANYLGPDRADWAAYDACQLLAQMDQAPEMLVDQGTADRFREDQLMPHKLATVCRARGHHLELRMQEGYDHSYYFISSFIADHISWHADRLAT